METTQINKDQTGAENPALEGKVVSNEVLAEEQAGKTAAQKQVEENKNKPEEKVGSLLNPDVKKTVEEVKSNSLTGAIKDGNSEVPPTITDNPNNETKTEEVFDVVGAQMRVIEWINKNNEGGIYDAALAHAETTVYKLKQAGV